MRAIETIIVLAILYLIAPYAQARDVTLAWDASTNADAYNVWRAEWGFNAVLDKDAWGAWQLIATSQTATTYIDTTAPELPVCAMWVVTATNAYAESGASNVAEDENCPPVAPPPAPPMNTRIEP